MDPLYLPAVTHDCIKEHSSINDVVEIEIDFEESREIQTYGKYVHHSYFQKTSDRSE